MEDTQEHKAMKRKPKRCKTSTTDIASQKQNTNTSVDKKIGTMEIKRLNLENCEEDVIDIPNCPESKDMLPPVQVSHQDPFFLDSASSYSQTILFKRNPTPNCQNQGRQSSKFFKGDASSYSSSYGNSNRDGNACQNKLTLVEESSAGISKFLKKVNRRQECDDARFSSGQAAEAEKTDLHPSWLAKRNNAKKLKIDANLSSTTRKIIKFEDD